MSHPPLERAGLCPCRKSGGSGGGRGCLEKESPRARHLSRKAGPWAPKPAKAILPRSRPFPLPGGPSVAPGPTQEAGLRVHPASPAASQGHAPPSRCLRCEAAVSGREVEKIYTKEHLMLSKFRKRQCPKGLLGPWLGVDQTRGGRGAPALKPRGAARPPAPRAPAGDTRQLPAFLVTEENRLRRAVARGRGSTACGSPRTPPALSVGFPTRANTAPASRGGWPGPLSWWWRRSEDGLVPEARGEREERTDSSENGGGNAAAVLRETACPARGAVTVRMNH